MFKIYDESGVLLHTFASHELAIKAIQDMACNTVTTLYLDWGGKKTWRYKGVSISSEPKIRRIA